jgi:hypothetical protein
LQPLDDTQPVRITINPTQAEEEAEGGVPGCLLWGVVGLFMLGLSVGIVLLSTLAAWNDGLRVATGNATATKDSDINLQCSLIPSDLANGSVGLANTRLESLATLTPAVLCVLSYAPQVTAMYLTSVFTPSPTPTVTPTSTATAEVNTTPEVIASPFPTSASGFDLNALFAEAQAQMASNNNLDAIETLDAIASIDPNFQKTQIDQMRFTALTVEATGIFRGGDEDRLAEAIVLANRAEQYGNIGELAFERDIAAIYLRAIANANLNYPNAIRAFSQIVYDFSSPNYRNAITQLNQQYVAYGTALLTGGDPCNARAQFDQALSIFNSADVSTSRSIADTQCNTGVIIGTPDPNATPGIGAPQPFPVINTPTGVAPIGQP